MKIGRIVPSLVIVVFLFHGSIAAQSTSFTYQGELQLSSQPANGTFDFEFLLYDASSGGTQIGATATRSNITVTDGRFTVSLDFGANFTGPERFLEIRVRQTGGGGFTILDPRQRIGSSPYAVRSVSAAAADTATTATNATNAVNATNAANATNATNATTAATAANALNLGGVAANQYVVTTDPRLSDARTPTAGSADYIQNSTIGQIGNFAISSTGRAANFNATNAFQINGVNVLRTGGINNLYIGPGTGGSSTGSIQENTFVGTSVGPSNAGAHNTFVGFRTAFANTTGLYNTFVGSETGDANTTGRDNAFFGADAGGANTTGEFNTFIGRSSGAQNVDGSRNTTLGNGASLGGPSLSFATAIGAGSLADASNSVVLGRSQDEVRVRGVLRIDTEIRAPQYNVGSMRVITGFGQDNLFLGNGSGASANLNAQENLFLGLNSGSASTESIWNVFVGTRTGATNILGSGNTLLGYQANVGSSGLSFATAIGANSTVSTSNTIALGRSNGADTVNIPGNLIVSGTYTGNIPSGSTNYVQNRTTPQAATNFNVSGNGTAGGTLSGNIVNATTQFDLGGSRVLGTPGTDNTFVGLNTGTATTGAANTFVGRGAGELTTTGLENSFFGRAAGLNNLTGAENSFFGRSAGLENTNGGQNSFFGRNAGRNSNANLNTMIGFNAGVANTTGSNNTMLGADANVASSGLSYATAIGAGSTVSSSNTIALGRSNGSDTVRVYGRLRLGLFGAPSAIPLCLDGGSSEITTCSSSLRYKENVFDYTSGLSLIRRLRPVYFDWKHNGVRDFGLVAEEVAAVEPLLATTNKDGEIQGVNYERIGVVLVNAVNEQQTVIETQQRQINDLLEANRRQQAQIEALTKLFCSANPAAGICREKP